MTRKRTAISNFVKMEDKIRSNKPQLIKNSSLARREEEREKSVVVGSQREGALLVFRSSKVQTTRWHYYKEQQKRREEKINTLTKKMLQDVQIGSWMDSSRTDRRLLILL